MLKKISIVNYFQFHIVKSTSFGAYYWYYVVEVKTIKSIFNLVVSDPLNEFTMGQNYETYFVTVFCYNILINVKYVQQQTHIVLYQL